uniref:Ubiquitin conjugating enzyme 2 n=1 Tax=Cladocopium sp. C3 TaxID=2558455 RepID=Q0R0E7_9DINO|nr:ubiquitin conjugating enzyme 2 [Cladocopium sp. C3]
MPCGSAQRRLLRDFKKMTADAPKGIQASPVGDDLFNWSAIVLGPQDTAWEGGVWKLKMSFNEEYPEKPPSVRFENEVFHPNIFPDGQICLDLLKGSGWSPAYDVCTILLAIQSLLADPDTHATPEGGANPEAESLFVRDRQGYYAKVKSLVDKQLEEDDMGCLSAVP